MTEAKLQNWHTMDANEAVASVAYRMSELVAIYPITPSSPMAEHCDAWSAAGKPNLQGLVPEVIEMQSEGGVAGAVHGAAMGGSLVTTFTASQGLLLMIPDLYRIAGELTPFVLHVAARAIATNTLSIFAEHADVMACRQTGVAMLASANVQEAQDMAAVAHAATLSARLPFLHFFDGFRTSHEIGKVQTLSNADLKGLVNARDLAEFRARGLAPERPSARGTASNPDVFFQSREACNAYYNRCVAIVEQTFEKFGAATGRHYKPFEYEGHPEAEAVIVCMGSGAETVGSTVEYLARDVARVGVVKVRLYRPFDARRFVEALPKTVRTIAVLDRTKEPGAGGEPLYLDVVSALARSPERRICVVGGRYGLGSKEFEPCMAKAVFEMLAADELRQSFTVGIRDDVTGLSLPYDAAFHLPLPGVTRALFFGLGSDGTVGANKNTIKIIGEDTPLFAQGYFVYDSKKSGGLTVSHLRFGPEPIRAPYLIRNAEFIAVHQPVFLRQKPGIFSPAVKGATLLVNFHGDDEALWAHLSTEDRRTIREKNCTLYRIDASAVARENGMGRHINGVMQAAFFAVSGVLPQEEAMHHIQEAIRKTYGRKGDEVVQKNCAAALAAAAALVKVQIPAADAEKAPLPAPDLADGAASDFEKRVTIPLIQGLGDDLPVSALPADGVWPTGTSRHEKRAIADFIPEWNSAACTECNQCILVCPHAALRATFVPEEALTGAPEGMQSLPWKGPGAKPGEKYVLQVSPADCTGCRLCVAACPRGDLPEGKPSALAMKPLDDERMSREGARWKFYAALPEPPKERLDPSVRTLPMRKPLFEFSGACSGCGQTPYVRTLTQLFGDRLVMANATGCSSIYGGNLPTTPYTKNAAGRGPAWANSLFEDNAEFGYGLMVSNLRRRDSARHFLGLCAEKLPKELVETLLATDQSTDAGVDKVREAIKVLRPLLEAMDGDENADALLQNADWLARRTIWTLGGDGWAYDIGYGGLDHVIASGRNVNILVMDTEVYSNTGGQQSKATPIGASARFAAGGKAIAKKDLTGIAMQYGSVYVAQICMGANPRQAIDALREAESYEGPSLVVAYAPCQEHGVELSLSLERQKVAIKTGYWSLFRFDPRRSGTGEALLKLDSPKPSLPVADFMHGENRFRKVLEEDSARAAQILAQAQANTDKRYAKLLALSQQVG
jgi:pyruvate-ferredoxin/flavodoxin oxidoreductase